MLLLKLKGTSRIIFGTLQNTTTTIDNEMTKSDKVLVDVRRLENEIERIRKTTTYYQSFRYLFFNLVNHLVHHSMIV